MRLFYLLFLALLACQKEPLKPTPEQPPVTTPKLNILWKVPIQPDTSGHSTLVHALVNGDVVCGTNFTLPSAFVHLRDGKTGNLKWKFDGFVYPEEGFLYNHVFVVHDKVIFSNCLAPAGGGL